jgi:hypothetical protein
VRSFFATAVGATESGKGDFNFFCVESWKGSVKRSNIDLRGAQMSSAFLARKV